MNVKSYLLNTVENTKQPITTTSGRNSYEYKMTEDDELSCTVEENPEIFDSWRVHIS